MQLIVQVQVPRVNVLPLQQKLKPTKTTRMIMDKSMVGEWGPLCSLTDIQALATENLAVRR